MGFLQTYKRLDNLCRDMNGVGVTGYLEDMERLTDGERHVPGWKEDCQQLKHYRYLRNRIAHEVNADEEDLCSAADTAWIENFYTRILGTNDPLALYRKAKMVPSSPDPQLHYRMAQTPPPTAEPPAGFSSKKPNSLIYSPYSDEKKRPTPMRPTPPPSEPQPHTGLALWLLFAACIALFFLSEFFR